jgi:hypothetical protein
MVTLPKPAAPLSPVRVKDTFVDAADWFVVIVMLEICELFMFPLIVSSTVAPVSVVADTVAGLGVGVGEAVGVGEGVGVEVVDELLLPPLESGVGVGVGVNANVAVIL